jgi:hypothetical protein
MMTLLVVLAGTVLLPAVVTIGMRQAGMISGLHLEVAEDRRWPFLAGSAFFLLTSRALAGNPFPPELSRYLLGLGLAILLAVFLLPRFKASAHMGGVGGLWGLTLYLAYFYGAPMAWPMAGLAVVTGAVWWARSTLQAHSRSELWWGLLLGALSVGGLLQLA